MREQEEAERRRKAQPQEPEQWQRVEREREAQRRRQQQRERPATQSEEDEWWSILEVSRDASAEQIRRTYLQKIQQSHPDRLGGLTPEFRELAETRAKRLNAAYTEAKRARRGNSDRIS